jgi:hypothetical protein
VKNSVDGKIFQESRNKIQLLTYPFSIDVVKAPDNLQLELIDLQSDSELKEKFNSVKCAFFFLLCDSKHSSSKCFFKMLSI